LSNHGNPFQLSKFQKITKVVEDGTKISVLTNAFLNSPTSFRTDGLGRFTPPK
jgi:hypothetical protein